VRALIFERNLARFGASRVASFLAGSGRGVKAGPLRLADIAEPSLPGPDWQTLTVSLSGICGSDLATLDGRSSRYFEEIVSFPFVPGHEIVATDGSGRRVVVEPVLGCATRHVEPLCQSCAHGDTGCCTSLDWGALAPGLQTGYCADTGGGWGQRLVAHRSQIHQIPDQLSQDDALMVEPAACGVHAAFRSRPDDSHVVAVLGSGTLGLATLASLRRWFSPKTLIATAKYPVQRRWAKELGADLVVEPDEILRAVRRATGTRAVVPARYAPVRTAKGPGKDIRFGAPERIGPDAKASPKRLAGGADVVVDCVGSSDSLATALSIVRPRGRVVMVGMPGSVRVDLAPLWQREVSLVGAYAYGSERAEGKHPEAPTRTFELAISLAGELALGRLVSALYPLERFAEAIAHAAEAGRRGAVKVAFDLARR
jgi:threonine dehydrogenase-like Zn-dependent dehydrogenase